MEIKAPTFPESIEDGTLAAWHKQPGESVKRDEPLADIETDKVVIEIVAPADGALTEIVKAEGETVLSDELIARFEPGAGVDAPWAQPRSRAGSGRSGYFACRPQACRREGHRYRQSEWLGARRAHHQGRCLAGRQRAFCGGAG